MRGRGAFVGLLAAPTAGTYVAPGDRSRRGRGIVPGLLALSVGGSSRAKTIQQRLPALTQTLEGGPVEVAVAIAQTLAALTQAATGTAAATNARSVRVSYLVLELPDPAITAVITSTLTAMAQAVEGSSNPDDRFLSIVQTFPAITQAVAADVTSVLTGVLTQTLPTLTQAGAVTVTAVVYGVSGPEERVWKIPRQSRLWRIGAKEG